MSQFVFRGSGSQQRMYNTPRVISYTLYAYWLRCSTCHLVIPHALAPHFGGTNVKESRRLRCLKELGLAEVHRGIRRGAGLTNVGALRSSVDPLCDVKFAEKYSNPVTDHCTHVPACPATHGGWSIFLLLNHYISPTPLS